MQTVREMIPEYEQNLDRLRQRRLDLLAERKLEPSFERRHSLTVRVYKLNRIIESTSAALRDMLDFTR